MEKELTIKIDASPLKELQEILTSISESLSETQSRAEKGITIAANVSGIMGALMSFDKFNRVANNFVDNGVEKIKGGVKVLKKGLENLPDTLSSVSKKIKNHMSDITDTVEKTAKKTSKTKFSFGGIAAVAGIVVSMASAFAGMLSSNEELSERMGEIWEKIMEALSPVTEVVMGLFDSFISGGEGATSILDAIIEIIGNIATIAGDVIAQIVTFFQENSAVIQEIVNSIWAVISDILATAQEIFAQVFETIATFFVEHGDEIVAIVSTVWGYISEILSGATKIFGGVFDVIVGIFTGNGEKIKEGFKKIWSGIKGIFSGMGEFFSGVWDKVVSIFKKVGTRIGDAIGGAFKAVVNTILGFAEDVINGFIKALNTAIGVINLIPGVNIKKLKLLVIPKLAEGGILQSGQMFIAREAGPELVGSFGAKTAVMNNNQIVESVSRGVYQAVRSAMGSGNGTYTFNITNTLDGKEIGKQVIKYHNGVVRQTGVSPLYI